MISTTTLWLYTWSARTGICKARLAARLGTHPMKPGGMMSY